MSTPNDGLDALTVRAYGADDAEKWDRFVSDSWNGTFLHTRRFLSYHGDRFRDGSVIVEEGREIVGLLPAALDPHAEDCIVSHPGSSYGGVVRGRRLRGPRMLAAVRAIAAHYRAAGFKRLRYKPTPAIYHRLPAEDDRFALWSVGARCTACQLSSTIAIGEAVELAKGRHASLTRAAREGVNVVSGAEHLPALWAILTENLARRHATAPVHAVGEIELLAARFPREIRCAVATVGDEVVAGAVLFCTERVIHAQYLASSPRGNELDALTSVIVHAMALARSTGARYFDFGHSNDPATGLLNPGLFAYKASFGSGATVIEQCELSLGESASSSDAR